MTRITFYVKPDNTIIGLESKGHAGMGRWGNDVVCASVSILIINTINSIEEFTSDKYQEEVNEKRATIKFEITGIVSKESALLFKSMEKGLTAIAKDYPGNVSIIYKEV
ncbi:MAG: ribosomal-processing cysteine protease Prp [Butyrivibrio sp.]|nr:ribosomal-processing cysteine protease Prp [Butyrivibrio sp.]